VVVTAVPLLQVILSDNTDDTVYDLESGQTDAALLRSDVLPHMQERGVINSSSFKFLDAVCILSNCIAFPATSLSVCRCSKLYQWQERIASAASCIITAKLQHFTWK